MNLFAGKQWDFLLRLIPKTIRLPRAAIERTNQDFRTVFFRFRASEIKITSPLINASTPLSFEFNNENKAKSASLLRLEYAIHFLKANGSHNKKVFKISERELKPGEQIQMERKQSFKPISTRKMYPGVHYVSLVVNGEEKKVVPFELE